MRSFAPSPALAPFVREIMLVDVRDTTTRVQLPEPGLVMGVRYRGSASLLAGGAERRLPDATLTGMRNRTRRLRTEAGGGIALAQFHPGGAAAFFPQPLHELFGATAALDDLVPRADVDRTRARVAEAATDAERVAALEAFLAGRLRRDADDSMVAAAVRAIADTHGALPIRTLARRLGISQDPLEKRFRRAVGASPKQLASLLRLRHAIDSYRPDVKLAQLALDAGYFDQSHFSRDLRAVTGQAPGRFLRGPR